jgi:hypothetical protein
MLVPTTNNNSKICKIHSMDRSIVGAHHSRTFYHSGTSHSRTFYHSGTFYRSIDLLLAHILVNKNTWSIKHTQPRHHHQQHYTHINNNNNNNSNNNHGEEVLLHLRRTEVGNAPRKTSACAVLLAISKVRDQRSGWNRSIGVFASSMLDR